MLISNLWVEAGLVNGAMGTVKAICYSSGEPPQWRKMFLSRGAESKQVKTRFTRA